LYKHQWKKRSNPTEWMILSRNLRRLLRVAAKLGLIKYIDK